MSKNLKSSILANMVVLIIAWICSNSFIWDLIYKFSPCNFYIAYQFLASSFFTVFSIMVTKDSVVFSQFWDKHLKMKKLLDITIHACAVFLYEIQYLVNAIGSGFSESERKEAEEKVKERVESIDEMPLVAKSFLIPAALFIILIMIISSGWISKEISTWISDILDMCVSLVTIPFLYCSIKEFAMDKENLD